MHSETLGVLLTWKRTLIPFRSHSLRSGQSIIPIRNQAIREKDSPARENTIYQERNAFGDSWCVTNWKRTLIPFRSHSLRSGRSIIPIRNQAIKEKDSPAVTHPENRPLFKAPT
ncbi:hypothetical protein CEXT_530141 [Caerostris extrusa]|uniref:Uncharacterized protein n=1 Tax=Caerostris extrusa TaxID=172846 RepID=A0AAV4XDT3_CAEEX|nr:hypothetical protein CEXT_530141 [Caerostris extrusa]